MFQDLRCGILRLLKNKGFTVAVVLTLALGIGANTAIFSIVKSVLIEPLPFAQPERLLLARLHSQSTGQQDDWVSHVDAVDWQARSRSFESIGSYRYSILNFAEGGLPEASYGVSVTHELLPMLGVRPALGRYFSPEEDRAEHNRVIILSDDLWRRRFAARREIIGHTIHANDESYVVVGVMPAGFNFPLKLATDLRLQSRQMAFWVAMGADATQEDRASTNCNTIFRLKPGVRAEQAQSEMDTITAQLAQDYPQTNTGRGVRLVSLKDQTVGDARRTLPVLFGAVGLVMLMVCANIANLLLVRADGQRKELAVRQALGASRFRLVRQALTESLLLALIGGTVGVAGAAWVLELVLRFSPHNIPRLTESRIDVGALGFALAITALTGLLFGFVPAWRAARVNLNEALKNAASNISVRRGSLRAPGNLLVASEIALALSLTLGAGLLLNSFVRLMRIDPGFRADSVLASIILLPKTHYPDASTNVAFFRRLIAQLDVTPDVEAAGTSTSLPLSGHGNGAYLEIEGHPRATSNDPSALSVLNFVSANYLRVMDIPLLRGRGLNSHDTAAAPAVAVINETAAQRFWPGEDPIGKRFNFSPGQWREVVGIVTSTYFKRLDEAPRAEVYVPIEQSPSEPRFLVMRSAMPQDRLAHVLRQAVAAVDPNQPVFLTFSMKSLIADSVATQRFSLWLFGVFSAVALLLAAVGIYGVVSYAVSQRKREIGICIALGAQSAQIIKMVIAQGMKPVAIGTLAGVAASMFFSRTLSSLLYGVKTSDPATFTGVTVLLLLVALFACYVPALGATKVDPLVALRHE